MMRFSAQSLQDWICSVFEKSGLSEKDARSSALLLVQTSLWGIDSHGVARVPHYLSRLAKSSINPRPCLQFTRTAPATGMLDGGHGLGFVVCARAMREAITLAKESGMGAVGVFNSSHCGAIGLYTRMAASAGMIGIGFTHSDSFVAPHNGKAAFFGTNPISIAMPSGDPLKPLCVDMATSVVPWNRIMNARREGHSIPDSWAMDSDGLPTTDPLKASALRPMSEHKGYALAFAIDMLCGPLNGMPAGPEIPKMYENLDQHRRLGSFFMAIDPARFNGAALFIHAIAATIAAARQTGPEVMAPGDPEYTCEIQRNLEGIPVEPELLRDIVAWCEQLHVSAPSPLS